MQDGFTFGLFAPFDLYNQAFVVVVVFRAVARPAVDGEKDS